MGILDRLDHQTEKKYKTPTLDEISDPNDPDLGKDELDKEFIMRLSGFIEKRFPTYTEVSNALANELRKHVKDGKERKAVKKKIMNILDKAKAKYLEKVETQVERIKVSTNKKKPQTNSDNFEGDK